MDKKTKILYGVLILAAIWAIGGAYYRYAFAMDYAVAQEVWCDPETEGPCFYYICENNWWTPCSGDPEEDIWIYKEITKPARDVEHDLFADDCGTDFSGAKECAEMACEEDDLYCEEVYCDPEAGEPCYTEETMDAVEEEWLGVLGEAGIEPVVSEEDEIEPEEEGEVEDDAAIEEESETVEDVENEVIEEE